MKCLWAILAWGAVCSHAALLPLRAPVQRDVTKQVAFLGKRSGAQYSGVQPWLYNPPPAPLPRSKPLEIPGDPLFLPPIDKMWGMQPTASPPTIEPPKKTDGTETGLQATLPPQSLEGWYATIPPQMIKDGLVDNRTAYYIRCLGGPNPCPYTVPPAVLRYWARVTPGRSYLLKAAAAGSVVLEVLANTGFAVGNTVTIDPMTPVQEVRTIVGLGSLILNAPLQFAHKEGAVVNVNVATTFPPMPFRPWANFVPFGAWNAFGPMPGPAPAPFPFPAGPAFGMAPAWGPPLQLVYPVVGGFGGPAPGPAGAPGGAPGGAPSPAPVR